MDGWYKLKLLLSEDHGAAPKEDAVLGPCSLCSQSGFSYSCVASHGAAVGS